LASAHKNFWFRPCEPYLVQGRDDSRKLNFFSLQKIPVRLRILAYGVTTDFMDEYIKIGGVTTIESLKIFVKAVVLVLSIGRILEVT